jgi:hypothetical protein
VIIFILAAAINTKVLGIFDVNLPTNINTAANINLK